MNNNKEYRSVIWNRYKKREETRSEFPAPAEKSKEFLSKNFTFITFCQFPIFTLTQCVIQTQISNGDPFQIDHITSYRFQHSADLMFFSFRNYDCSGKNSLLFPISDPDSACQIQNVSQCLCFTPLDFGRLSRHSTKSVCRQ